MEIMVNFMSQLLYLCETNSQLLNGPQGRCAFWRRVKPFTPHWKQNLNCPAPSLANIPNAGWSNVCVCVCHVYIRQLTLPNVISVRWITNCWNSLLSLVQPHNTKIMQMVHAVAWCTWNLKSMHCISITAGPGFSSTFRVEIREVRL
jgi:hypothetical protein